MKITKTEFEDLLILEPQTYSDERGLFFESYNCKTLKTLGLDINFVQDNQSKSRRGVLRGLHFQNAPFAQSKLIRVLSGSILDIVVDLRRAMPTFGRHFSLEISSDNKKQLFVPKGFAHGFLVLSETSEILYKCDEYYHPEAEGGIIFDDLELAIDWKINRSEIILSKRDLSHPKLREAIFKF